MKRALALIGMACLTGFAVADSVTEAQAIDRLKGQFIGRQFEGKTPVGELNQLRDRARLQMMEARTALKQAATGAELPSAITPSQEGIDFAKQHQSYNKLGR